MIISEICIKRPVFATVLSLIIMLLGIISFTKLSIREYPDIDPPIISVDTSYTGASSEIMESQVTNILEEELNSISGIDVMKSSSKQGQSSITITFNLGVNLEEAANDVRDKVQVVRAKLPKDIDNITVSKADSDADPILYLAVTSDELSNLEISDYADRYLKDSLQTIDGIASVRLLAERQYSIRIYPDDKRLQAYGVTINEIIDAVQSQNIEYPSGVIEGYQREYSILVKTDLNSVKEFEDIIVKNSQEAVVRLKDLAKVKLDALDESIIARYKQKNAIALGIVKQSDANPLEISKAIRKKLKEIEHTLPSGIKIDLPYDQAEFIKASVDAVYSTIFESLILVTIIVYLFLGNFRSLLVPIVTIPVSIIGAFTFMFALHFSVNTLTLLAIILAIGLVVDDAIVMMENIYSYIERGKSPFEAAMIGSKEIGFAVIAMTLTLASVFIPIGFMDGVTGKLFTEFAWTLALTVIVSGFVALSLSPMMSSRFLKHHEISGTFHLKIQGYISKLISFYEKSLIKLLNARKLVISLALIFALIGGFVFKSLSSELAPTEDRGFLLSIFFGPEGSSLELTDQYAKRLEQIYTTIPEVDRFFTVVGMPIKSKGISFLKLKDWSDRDISSMALANKIMPMFIGAVPGLMAFPIAPSSLSGSSSGIQFVIQTTKSYEELSKVVDLVMQDMKEAGFFVNMQSDLVLNQPRIELDINRDKAGLMGVNISDIGETLSVLFGSKQISTFKQNAKQYYVVAELERADRLQTKDIEGIYVKAQGGNLVPLATLINSIEVLAPRELNHFNRMRSAQITASLLPVAGLSDAVAVLENSANKHINNNFGKHDFDGEAREYIKSSYALYFTFALAVAFIYLVLSAQFESFKDPLIIMLSVPLSITGALIALYLTHQSLNIYSKIGLVTLIGLITKNGILIVEFTNQLLEQGLEVKEAIIQASIKRFRPILMTNLATALGAVPLALSHGPGSESRHSIGWVIIGGLMIGTAFTVYVIPIVCSIFKRKVVVK